MDEQELRLKLKEMEQELLDLKAASQTGLGLINFCKKSLRVRLPHTGESLWVTATPTNGRPLLYLTNFEYFADGDDTPYYTYNLDVRQEQNGTTSWSLSDSPNSYLDYCTIYVIGSGDFSLSYTVEEKS